MTRYAAENFSLRQENRQLRSLESVVKAEEAADTIAAELDETFQRAMEIERLTESKIIISLIKWKLKWNILCPLSIYISINLCSTAAAGSSTPVAADTVLAATTERLKAQLLQKQSDLTAALQAYEEYKEITK